MLAVDTSRPRGRRVLLAYERGRLAVNRLPSGAICLHD
jgi:hypothetical protein